MLLATLTVLFCLAQTVDPNVYHAEEAPLLELAWAEEAANQPAAETCRSCPVGRVLQLWGLSRQGLRFDCCELEIESLPALGITLGFCRNSGETLGWGASPEVIHLSDLPASLCSLATTTAIKTPPMQWFWAGDAGCQISRLQHSATPANCETPAMCIALNLLGHSEGLACGGSEGCACTPTRIICTSLPSVTPGAESGCCCAGCECRRTGTVHLRQVFPNPVAHPEVVWRAAPIAPQPPGGVGALPWPAEPSHPHWHGQVHSPPPHAPYPYHPDPYHREHTPRGQFTGPLTSHPNSPPHASPFIPVEHARPAEHNRHFQPGRVMHLHEAARHLDAAGLHEEAHQYRRRAEEMEHHTRRILEEKEAQLHQLQREVEELRRMIHHHPEPGHPEQRHPEMGFRPAAVPSPLPQAASALAVREGARVVIQAICFELTEEGFDLWRKHLPHEGQGALPRALVEAHLAKLDALGHVRIHSRPQIMVLSGQQIGGNLQISRAGLEHHTFEILSTLQGDHCILNLSCRYESHSPEEVTDLTRVVGSVACHEGLLLHLHGSRPGTRLFLFASWHGIHLPADSGSVPPGPSARLERPELLTPANVMPLEFSASSADPAPAIVPVNAVVPLEAPRPLPLTDGLIQGLPLFPHPFGERVPPRFELLPPPPEPGTAR